MIRNKENEHLFKYQTNKQIRHDIDRCLHKINANHAKYMGVDSTQVDIDTLNGLNEPLKDKIKELDHEHYLTLWPRKIEWISVKDELPSHENNVLAVLDGETCIMNYFSFIENGEKVFVWGYVYDGLNGDGIFDDNYYPTHWMEIPKYPLK